MNKDLFNALSDIEAALFGLKEVSDALYVYHSSIEEEIDIIAMYSCGGSPKIKDRTDTVLSILTLSQKALIKCRNELTDALHRAYAATRTEKPDST